MERNVYKQTTRLGEQIGV